MSGPDDTRRTVGLADDAYLVAAGLRAILAGHSWLKFIEIDSRKAAGRRIDLALYDPFREGTFNHDTVDRLRLNPSVARVGLYSWRFGAQQLAVGYRSGADAYLSKELSAASLVTAIERAIGGERLLAIGPRPWGVFDDAVAQAAGPYWPGRAEGLTFRESEVISLVAQGLQNKEIADSLYLSLNSVKSYLRAAYLKMGVVSRSQVVLWALSHGFHARAPVENVVAPGV